MCVGVNTTNLADGKDYTYTYGTDVLDDDDSSECNSVPIISDNIVEEEECFTVNLFSTSTYPGLALNPEVAIVCIRDDDGELVVFTTSKWQYYPLFSAAPVTIGLEKTVYSVYEPDKYQVVCVKVISGDIAGRNITLNYVAAKETANGTNYTVY